MRNEQMMAPVEVITPYYRYAGSMLNRGYRIADVLGDSNTDLVEIHNALITPAGPGSTTVRCEQISMEKKDILLAVPKGSHEAPRRRHDNYIAKDRYGAMLMLPGYVLSGIMHLPSRATAMMLLEEDSSLGGFIGVTDVTVHNSVHGFLPKRCDVVILRREAIESVQLTLQPLAKAGETIGAD